MVDPISLTVSSMQNDMQRMNVLANNSANALTPGFKREIVAASGQYGTMAAVPGVPGASVAASTTSIVIDRTPGVPRKTGASLDVALLGEGYLEVKTDKGPAYTRLGALHVDGQGRLATKDGHPVQGLGGEIYLTSSSPEIDKEGRLYEKGALVGQFKTVAFDRAQTLLSIGGGLVVPQGDVAAAEEARPRILQGHLESSNVDTTREMVTLVQTFRHFEAGVRVLQAYDDIRDKAFRNLGQF